MLTQNEKNRPRVVVIDDSDDCHFFAAKALQQASPACSIVQYLDSRLAVADLLNFRGENMPDVVFIDLKMPFFDGFDVLKALAVAPAYASVAKIILSSSDRIQDVELAYQHGANGYLIKNLRLLEAKLVLIGAARLREGADPSSLAMPGIPAPSSRYDFTLDSQPATSLLGTSRSV